MITTKRNLRAELTAKKYSFISGNEFAIAPELQSDYESFREDWEHLELDKHLKNGAKFRYRRFNYFYYHPKQQDLHLLPFEAFFQPLEDNNYAGGINREFAPLRETTAKNRFMQELIKFSFWQTPESKDEKLIDEPWKVEVHQVRVVASENENGEPTPEGIHRDGGESGFVYLINRQNASNAVSSVYTNDRKIITRFTLSNPMDTMMFLDPHLLHSVSALTSKDSAHLAIRDVFLFGFFHTPELNKP